MTNADSAHRIRMGLVSKTFYYTPIWVAIEKGMFREAGLAVELSYLGSDIQIQSLLEGGLDITIAPPEGIVQNAIGGGPLRIIAGNSDKLSHWLMARPEIKSIEQLRGRTFGILNRTEGSFFHFQILAEKHHLFYPTDYQIQETGGAPSRHRALTAGTLDAGLQSIPWCFLGEDMGLSKLADISDYVPDWQFNTINADMSWCQNNPQVAVAALRAIQSAVHWIYAHREESAEIAARAMEIDLGYALRAWDYFTTLEKLTRNMRVSVSGMSEVIESQIRAGLLPTEARGNLQRWVDERWLNEAQQTPL